MLQTKQCALNLLSQNLGLSAGTYLMFPGLEKQ